jgi:O-antigen/teichoic acid export membrane protein
MDIIIKRTLKGGLGLFLDRIIITLLNFVFVFIAARFLGPTKFGLLAISISVFTIFEIFSRFGLHNTIQRFLSGKDGEGSGRNYGAILFIGSVSTFITFIILFFSASFISSRIFNEPELAYLLRYLSIALLFSTPLELSRAVLIAKEKINSIIIIDVVHYAVRLILFVSLFFIFNEIRFVIWAINIGYVFSLVVAIIFLKTISLKPKFNYLQNSYRNIFNYSIPILFVGFSYIISSQTDRLMLGIFSTAFAVGIYALITKLSELLSFLHGSFLRIFMTIASDAYRNGNIADIKKSYFFINRWVGITNGIILMIFAGFGKKIIYLFGEDYSVIASYKVLLIIGFYSFFVTWVGPSGALLQMTNKQRIELINTIVFILINILLNYFLIPIYGVFGAAYATLISGVIRNLMQIIEIRSIYKFYPFGKGHLFLLSIAVLAILAVYFFGSYFNIDVIVSLLSIGSIVLFAFLSITDQEKLMYNKIKSRLFIKG